MKKLTRLLLIVMVYSILIVNTGCDSSSSGNQAPEILSVTANPEELQWGELSYLSVSAEDPEGEELNYSWTCDNGCMDGDTECDCAVWRAPNATGTFPVKVCVSDGEKETSRSATIEVTLPYLYYDDGTFEGNMTAGALDFQIWTGFSKPSDWEGCVITTVQIYITEGSQSFKIVGQDDYIYTGGYYHPASNYNWSNLKTSCSQSPGWYDYDISVSNSFESSRFFVALECMSSTGPYIGVDSGSYCAGRSGFCGMGYNLVVTDADWGIRVYVVPAGRDGELIEGAAGVWLEAETELSIQGDVEAVGRESLAEILQDF